MTVYRKCRLCRKRNGCSIKADIGRVISGLGITSLLHKCAEYDPPFKAGDPVLVTTLADCSGSGWDENGPPTAIFPGHFLAQHGQKAHVYIEPDIEDVEGNHFEFAPKSNGYCTLSYARVRPNPDGNPEQICRVCLDIKCQCGDLNGPY